MSYRRLALLSFFLIFFSWPVLAGAEDLAPIISGEVKIFDLDGRYKGGFPILGETEAGAGINWAIGDVVGDNKKELLVCTPVGEETKVIVYDNSGKKLTEFVPFPNFFGGCYIATAKIDTDDKDEIIVSAGFSGGPYVKIFDYDLQKSGFFAFNKNLRNGVRALGADLGTDGLVEIIAFTNYNQEAELAFFGNDNHKFLSTKLGGMGTNGISVAIGDFFGNGKKNIAISGGFGSEPIINILNIKGEVIKTINYHRGDYRGGLNLTAVDTDGNGKDELIIGESFAGSGILSIYDIDGLIKAIKIYDSDYKNGLKGVVTDWDGDGKKELLAVPERVGKEINSAYKSIAIDLKKQKFNRYQDGKLLDSFLISSGKAKTPTVRGVFSVYRKRPNVRMSGPGYDLPNVPWVLSFYGAYAIHGTYWHSNFGNPMSHGCVNMRTPEAKMVYDWSEIGTPVVVY